MAPSATLRDVAKLAGVSIGTASQALNNRPNVLPDTRERVLKAAQALGYVSPSSQSERQCVISTIGMLTKHDYGPPPELNVFFSHVQAGVEMECRANKINLMFSAIEVDQSNRPIDWPRMIDDRQIDGLLLLGTNIDAVAHGLRRKLGTPIVLVDSYAPGYNFDSILIDNLGGAMQAVNHLLDFGHRHIGLIGTNPESPPDILERREGYRRALRARGIEREYIEDGLMEQGDGYRATRRLLRASPEVTAIFVANDDTALGVINAARDLGLRVPDELSIVGFDDVDLAREIRPSLTTVHVHKTWLGRLAVRRLIERAQNPDQPHIVVTVATHLVERESTKSRRDTMSKEVRAIVQSPLDCCSA
ncbi:MAG: LacI family DNA-binding transcriptional regulator [Anaerolineae bacterium]|nr:LacI family transcriptional regulator [Thermoflexales bacterium]MDW8408050.1 LacI family DNA-binding transcriptional regulator [Anaerolineae bacterium]